jgi:hypothetical protein
LHRFQQEAHEEADRNVIGPAEFAVEFLSKPVIPHGSRVHPSLEQTTGSLVAYRFFSR